MNQARARRRLYQTSAILKTTRTDRFMKREEVKACIEEIGIFPGIRVIQKIRPSTPRKHSMTPASLGRDHDDGPRAIGLSGNWQSAFQTWLSALEQCWTKKLQNAASMLEPGLSRALDLCRR